jgi:hypothetical protein
MSQIADSAEYKNNPFIFFGQTDFDGTEGLELDLPNPLRAIYERLVEFCLLSKSRDKSPYSMKGKAAWTPFDPISQLDPASIVPGIIEGMPTKPRKRREIIGEPEPGLATFLNIIVDSSGSMDSSYGHTPDGYPLCGLDLARFAAALMVGQAQINDDRFAIYAFASTAAIVWDGPAGGPDQQDVYEECVEWLLGLYSSGRELFPNLGGGTNPQLGMQIAAKEMQDFMTQTDLGVKSCVTVVISDGMFDESSVFNTPIEGSGGMGCDEWFRQYGPVFYIYISESIDNTSDDPLAGTFSGQAASLRKALQRYYGLDDECDGCIYSFGINASSYQQIEAVGGTFSEMVAMNDPNIETNLECCRNVTKDVAPPPPTTP